VRALIELLGTQAALIDADVRTAAGQLAAVAGPVLGIVKSAIEAIGAVTAYVPAPNLTALDAGMTQVTQFIARLVLRMGEAAGAVDRDVRAAAATFIAVADPAIALLSAALEMLVDLSWYLPVPDMAALTQGMQAIIGFVQTLVLRVGEAGTAVAGVTPAVEAFIALARPAMDLLREGMSLLTEIGSYVPAPNTGLMEELIGQIVAYVTLLAQRVREIITGGGRAFHQEVLNLQGFATGAATDFQQAVAAINGIGAGAAGGIGDGGNSWFTAGYEMMENLALGIQVGMDLVVAQVTALAGLFPPATWGPLVTPPDWAGWRGGNWQEQGGGDVVQPLASGGGAVTINFTYAPALSLASQREAEEAIAPVLARVLAREARRV